MPKSALFGRDLGVSRDEHLEGLLTCSGGQADRHLMRTARLDLDVDGRARCGDWHCPRHATRRPA